MIMGAGAIRNLLLDIGKDLGKGIHALVLLQALQQVVGKVTMGQGTVFPRFLVSLAGGEDDSASTKPCISAPSNQTNRLPI